MSFLGTIGAYTLGRWGLLRETAATAATAALACFDPRLWPRTVREVFVRQVYFTAVQAVPFISLIAVVTGVVVVVQAQVWLNRVGQTTLVGPVLVFIMVREVGPLITNFVVIGRSGSAMTAEMASMKVSGEVHVLDAQGLDPFVYLLLPRAAGMAVSVCCLSVVFVVVSLVTGYLVALFLGGGALMPPRSFLETVMMAITPVDWFNLFAKTLIPGLLTGVICVSEGLSVGRAVTEIPRAAGRGVIRSVTALLLTSALVLLMTY